MRPVHWSPGLVVSRHPRDKRRWRRYDSGRMNYQLGNVAIPKSTRAAGLVLLFSMRLAQGLAADCLPPMRDAPAVRDQQTLTMLENSYLVVPMSSQLKDQEKLDENELVRKYVSVEYRYQEAMAMRDRREVMYTSQERDRLAPQVSRLLSGRTSTSPIDVHKIYRFQNGRVALMPCGLRMLGDEVLGYRITNIDDRSVTLKGGCMVYICGVKGEVQK